MRTYISLLRGINVSGKNIIKMKALQEMYLSMGFTGVSTYIQSGNVIFRSRQTAVHEMERKISIEILSVFKYNVPVIILEQSELKRVLEQNPLLYPGREHSDKLYFTFLSRPPDEGLLHQFNQFQAAPEEFFINGKVIYLYCPDGYGKAKLNNAFIETRLKVNASTRNLKTLTEIMSICKGIN
jgi:uncharacterized protein (DUF1697 family)